VCSRILPKTGQKDRAPACNTAACKTHCLRHENPLLSAVLSFGGTGSCCMGALLVLGAVSHAPSRPAVPTPDEPNLEPCISVVRGSWLCKLAGLYAFSAFRTRRQTLTIQEPVSRRPGLDRLRHDTSAARPFVVIPPRGPPPAHHKQTPPDRPAGRYLCNLSRPPVTAPCTNRRHLKVGPSL